jgi:L-ascorbate metabolism protein UlaG (beta-lactamase superfamily)
VAIRRQLFTRRRFVSAGALAGAGTAAWVGTSSSWTARFLRERFAERGREIPPAPRTPDPSTWSDNALSLAWLGHATVLINCFGVRILTDPVLFSRIGVDMRVGTLGPMRLVHCALTPEQLPEIDVVLVSHAHFDHLDIRSLGVIRGMPAAVMASATADLLPRTAYSSVTELRWNESTTLTTPRGELLVRAIEVRHWGARLQRDTYRGYNGFIVEREGRRILIGGDTAYTPLFQEHRRCGPFDVAVMPIGAYDPWIRNHCTPEQAVAMADAAGARLFVPVHHQSFRLSSEPVLEPIERAERALAAERGRLALREIGETAIVPA